MKELNLTNTQIAEFDPTRLAECSLKLEKISLSNPSENQTMRIFKLLSLSKISKLKSLRLEGVGDFDGWYNEGGYISTAIAKLENLSINFKQYQSSARLETTRIPLFMKLLFLNQSEATFNNNENCLKQISIQNKNISLLCNPGNYEWPL